jgi:hypothetical protein
MTPAMSGRAARPNKMDPGWFYRLCLKALADVSEEAPAGSWVGSEAA